MTSEINEGTNDDLEISSDVPIVSDQQNEFVLETEGQIADGIESLNNIQEIQPETWANLDLNERVAALQSVEDQLANIQERPSVPVIPFELPPDNFGGWDGESIKINIDHLTGDQPVAENVDTVLHEGRHAYQDYLMEHPDTVKDPSVIETWRENIKPENYISSEFDPEGYRHQPIEEDAWSYAAAIREGIYNR